MKGCGMAETAGYIWRVILSVFLVGLLVRGAVYLAADV